MGALPKPKNKRPRSNRSPRVLGSVSGAGGISAGFAHAGYEIVTGIDCWEPAIASFQTNFPDAIGLTRDLREKNFGDITDLVGSGIDVVVGGPSCQGFSTSGGLSRCDRARTRETRANRLFLNYIDLVDELRPSWVVFENVPGLLLYNQGQVALEIVRGVSRDRIFARADDLARCGFRRSPTQKASRLHRKPDRR